ncbi:MAG: aldehyde dehydrogenase family protein, partial [Sphingomicrobium sp.]
MTPMQETAAILRQLGVSGEGALVSHSPIDGSRIGSVAEATDVAGACELAQSAFLEWRNVPAPRRGELVRLLGEELRAAKEPLARLVTLEAGKIVSEGLGEVQEMIDICDYAVGLSRQLYGLTIASERPEHRMIEQWHPLGPVVVISAFNFPVAVWAWNAALALVCGDPVLWKPSEKTPLTAAATMAITARALARFGDAPDGLLQVLQGGREVGAALADDPRVALVSATGSTRMGRELGPKVAARFGRSLLELGGNNAMIVAPSADLALAERAILFSAAGTAGQRCTSLRRLIVHDSIADGLVERLHALIAKIPV